MFEGRGGCRGPKAPGTLLFASTLLILAGCGGGNPSPALPSATPVANSPEGVWRGTLTSSNGAEAGTAVALVAPDQAVRIITGAGFQYVAGAGFQASGTAYAPAGQTFADGSAVATMTGKSMEFNTSSSTHCGASAGFSFNCTAGGDTVQFVSKSPDPAHATPLALATLSGTYTSGASANSLGQTLTLVVADGVGTVAVPGGDTFKVEFTVPDPGFSAVGVTLAFVPAGGGAGDPVQGTGSFLARPGAAAPVLIFGAAGGTRAFAGSFTKG